MSDDAVHYSLSAQDERQDLELRNGVTVLTVRLQMVRRRANQDPTIPEWLRADLERLEAATVRLVQLVRSPESPT